MANAPSVHHHWNEHPDTLPASRDALDFRRKSGPCLVRALRSRPHPWHYTLHLRSEWDTALLWAGSYQIDGQLAELGRVPKC